MLELIIKVGNLHSGGKTEQGEEKTNELQTQTVYQQSCTHYKCQLARENSICLEQKSALSIYKNGKTGCSTSYKYSKHFPPIEYGQKVIKKKSLIFVNYFQEFQGR